MYAGIIDLNELHRWRPALQDCARAFIPAQGQQFIAQHAAERHRMATPALLHRCGDDGATTHPASYRADGVDTNERHVGQRHQPSGFVRCRSNGKGKADAQKKKP